MNEAHESPTSYDEVEYASFPFQQSHPERLATIATLFGMQPAKLDRCRVLELGSSSGGNLIPLADRFTNGRFLGVDASTKAIEKGRQTIQALDLRNIDLRHADIMQLDESVGEFDYILVHGVFSWVPSAVQDKILELCSRQLAPQGTAYISYNTYPGWHFRGMIRDVMAYHGQFFDTPQRQLNEARALVNFLSKSVPTEKNPYGMLLSRELKLLQDKQDYYLFHEYLEDINDPLYFHQFMQRATSHGLQYLGESDFSSMSASNFPPHVERLLRHVSDDTIRMEQYMDFVRNRMFRQTLLCRADVTLDRTISPERVFDLFVASNARPAQEIDPRSRDTVTFERPGSAMTTSEPLVKAAMLHLVQQWPRPVYFRDLLNAARRALNPGPLVLDAARVKREAELVAAPLIRCYSTTHVDLSFNPPNVTLQPPEFPLAPRLARYQATESNRVTNLWHQTVHLSDLQRQLLKVLDGSHDRAALVEQLAGQAASGALVVHDQGSAVTDAQRSRELLMEILDKNLEQIAGRGLLLSSL